MSAPKITTTAADAPFQTAWKIDAAHIHFSERKALMDGLRLEIAGMIQEPWSGFAEDHSHLTVMDPSQAVIDSLTAVVDRFNNRRNIKAEEVKLPRVSLLNRFKVWLRPAHMAPVAFKRLGNCCLVDGRYQFEIELHGTRSDVHFIQTLKLICKSRSCKGTSFKLRGNLLTVSAKRSGPVQTVWASVHKLHFDKVGSAAAICPGKLWLYTLLPVWELDEAV